MKILYGTIIAFIIISSACLASDGDLVVAKIVLWTLFLLHYTVVAFLIIKSYNLHTNHNHEPEIALRKATFIPILNLYWVSTAISRFQKRLFHTSFPEAQTAHRIALYTTAAISITVSYISFYPKLHFDFLIDNAVVILLILSALYFIAYISIKEIYQTVSCGFITISLAVLISITLICDLIQGLFPLYIFPMFSFMNISLHVAKKITAGNDNEHARHFSICDSSP